MRSLVLALVVLMLSSPVPAEPPADVHLPRNVVLIGWDGAQRQHLLQSLERGDLPFLAALAEEGALVEIDIEGATDTKAGWAQILTGHFPETTGVFHNRRFRPIPEGLTVFERLEAFFGPENFATLAVIGKSSNVGGDGPKMARIRPRRAGAHRNKRRPAPIGEVVEADGVRFRVTPGQPFFLAKESMDHFENGLELDAVVGVKAVELIEANRDRPFFLFVHFAEVDSSGHKHGENSKEYDEALGSNDLWTGAILEKLRELDLYDSTLVYVTADHGFDEGGRSHKNAPYVFLATNDRRVIRNGLRRDVAPTILDAFGLDLEAFDPPLDGVSLRRPVERGEIKLGPQPGLYEGTRRTGLGEGD